VGVILNEAEFGRLLATFEQTAFRLELQPTYNEEFENAWLARWLAGDRTPPTEHNRRSSDPTMAIAWRSVHLCRR